MYRGERNSLVGFFLLSILKEVRHYFIKAVSHLLKLRNSIMQADKCTNSFYFYPFFFLARVHIYAVSTVASILALSEGF